MTDNYSHIPFSYQHQAKVLDDAAT